MTEYDYSPEAYERFMATQTRISNWIDNVSQSMQTPSPSSRHSYDHPHHPPHHPHHSQQQQQQQQSQYHQPQRHSSRHIYSQSYPQQQQQPQQHTHSNSHSQTHSRTNSLSRRSSRTRQQSHYQDPSRPRSYSQTGGRPQAVHTHTAPIPPPPPPPQMHSRTYSYAMNNLPPPLVPGGPIPVPQQVPYPHLAPRRSRTLPPQTQNVVYHTYDAPRGGPTYVMVPPVFGGAPHGQQYRMQSSPMAPKRPHQPLLKRLFTSFGPWGSSSGSSPKGKFAPRRHPRRSSF